MKYFKIIMIIIGCLFISGCREKYIEEVPSNFNIVLKNNGTIKVYEDVTLYNLIDEVNAKILSEDVVIDTTTLGDFKYQIKVELDKKKYLYDLKYSVEDTEAPLVLTGTAKSVDLNYKDDLCDLLWVADNYDKKAKCTIKGEYDLSKLNSYDLIYIFRDSSGNETIKNITLQVVEPSNNTNNSTGNKIAFNDILNTYKNDNNEIGIDVSKWQGKIDFRKVKEAGATFVMIRIGVQGMINGELSIDSYFEQNIKNAKEAGLKVGIYLYSIATSKKESIEHAKWVINKLNGELLDLPIVFDWESWSSWNSYNLSLYDINIIADAFIETVNNDGYKGMLYSSKNYLQYVWTNKYNHPVWLAHYTKETDYDGNYIMWQLTNQGRINGITGDVDINVMYK